MRIDGKDVILFLSNCYENATYVATYNTETKKKVIKIIGGERNDSNSISYIFESVESHKKACFVGWRCHKYDCMIVNYIIKNRHEFYSSFDYYFFCRGLDNENDYTYDEYFYSIDLCKMLFAEKQRCSLRQMAFSLNIQLSEFDSLVKIEDKANIENIITDIASKRLDAFVEIFNINVKKLDYRLKIYQKYRVDCLSADDTIMGLKLLTKKYLQTGKKYNDIILNNTKAKIILVSELLRNEYSFSNDKINSFYKDFIKLRLNPLDSGKKSFNKTIIVDYLPLSLSVGGVRTLNKPNLFMSDSNTTIVKLDFTSMFPSVMTKLRLFPSHLDNDFAEMYILLLKDRIEAKKAKNKEKSDTLKLILNSTIGLMNSEWSWLYDPNMNLSIRLNSMMITLTLIDKLLPSSKIIQVNVDGVMFSISNDKLSLIDKLTKFFNDKYGIMLEEERYLKLYQYSVNDYIGVKDNGDIVKKGLFSYTEQGKSLSPKIVKDAISNYLINNVPIKKTIDNGTISDYLMTVKVTGDCSVFINNRNLSNIVRYYYSEGAKSYLLERRKDGKKSIIDSNSGVTVCDKIKIVDKINYKPYYKMANKIIYDFENKSLFDMFV